MSQKHQATPDSDQTARHRSEDLTDLSDFPDNIEGLQTSNKTGKHSSVEKLAASRSDFAPRPSVHPDLVDENMPSVRCPYCGRAFYTESDLSDHEVECRLAKEATHRGDN